MTTLGPSDREAEFERIFNEYREMAFRVAYGVLRDRQRAEDAVQEAFVRVYRNLAAFEGRSSPKTWVYRIVVNASLNALPARTSASLEFSPEPVATDRPSHAAERLDLGRRLAQAVSNLPERQQAAFLLKNQEGLPYAEIAEVLEIRLGTVKALIHQATQNLRKTLNREAL